MSAMNCRIQVVGRLGSTWSHRLPDLVFLHHQEEGGRVTTEITGAFIDQAALMGILEQVYSHGAHLLSVEVFDPGNGEWKGQAGHVRTCPTRPAAQEP